ncbi:ribose ABC transporter permease, partial [Bacillus sp. SIMBA_074]|uniref:ABC transporter permease subunit n=1 Tax=Bacillus sp. SIMBA_074 TaxID=3085812 RepID=UPI0039783A90
SNLVRQTSIGALVAFGQTFVIITAGIDLSVGAVVGLSGVTLALLNQAGVPFPLAVVLTLLLGALIGVYHGFGVHNLGLPPFIMTLAS